MWVKANVLADLIRNHNGRSTKEVFIDLNIHIMCLPRDSGRYDLANWKTISPVVFPNLFAKGRGISRRSAARRY